MLKSKVPFVMTPKSRSILVGGESDKLSSQTWFYLAFLLIFLTLHNAWWLHRDIIDPLWDEAVYLIGSMEVFEKLRVNGISAIKDLYFLNEGPRPLAFFALFSLPFYAIFGATAKVAILSTNAIFSAILIFSTFFLGRHLFDTRTGLLATFVTVLTPGLSILTRVYWPHYSVAAVASLATYLLLKSDGFSRTLPSLGFGFVLGVGVMIRPVYPALFLLAPLSWVLGQALLNGLSRSDGGPFFGRGFFLQLRSNILTRLIGRALPALVLVLIIAGPFYLPKFIETFKFVSAVQSSNEKFVTAGAFWYLQNLPEFISPFVCLLLAIGVAFGLTRLNPSTGFLIFSLLGTFLVVSAPSFKRDYYIPPLFPLIAITATYWIFGIYRSWIRRVLVGVTLLMSLGAFLVTAWGFPPFANSFLQRVFDVQSSKPNKVDWKMSAIADLIRLNSGANSVPKVGFIGDAMLSMETFSYLAGPKVDNFVYARPAPPGVKELDTLLTSDYVVIVKPNEHSHIKKESLAEIRRLGALYWHEIFWNAILGGNDKTSAFSACHQIVGEVELDDGLKIEVYVRTQAVSPDEILNLSSALIDLNPEIASLQIEHILERQESLKPELLDAYTKSLFMAKTMKMMDD